jgi:cobalt-zinc-cadmium efflux system protein
MVHHHNHSKEHYHASPNNQGRVFVTTIILNMTFVVIEFAYGFIANSTALIADAGHNISAGPDIGLGRSNFDPQTAK